jgi:beta-phosphoglucomutase family hydrolase
VPDRGNAPPITPANFDACLFDVDGVLTQTALVHGAAWKQMFDDYLEARANRDHTEFVPFDPAHDYVEHVDGKPRYDGVRDFLTSREITLPEGSPDDPPGRDTVCGLGNRKDELFEQIVETDGVKPCDGAVRLVHAVRDAGIKTAVVSSSKNTTMVLDAVGIRDLFDTQVDGHTVEDEHLAGKPAPDAFLAAAERLGAAAARTVVFEDALVGVEAGRNGKFGLVVGVDRGHHADALMEHGADVVVTDLAELIPD